MPVLKKLLKKYPAKVIMSRFTGNDGTGVHVQVEDETSGCRVLELWLTLEEFGKAITASYGDAEMEWYPNAPVGKNRQVKTELVTYTGGYKDKEAAKAAIAPFEVDGWVDRAEEVHNHYNNAGGNNYRVAFTRFVD